MTPPARRLARVRTEDCATRVTVHVGDRHLLIRHPAGGEFADVRELLSHDDGRALVSQATEPLLEPIVRGAAGRRAKRGFLRRAQLPGPRHRARAAHAIASHPIFKLPRALVGPQDNVVLPSASAAVDYEGEVVAVIGSAGRNISVDHAWDHIAGVTLMNDVSLRDLQNRTSQWLAGKTWERSTPVGPEIALVDAQQFAELRLATYVNGELRQHGALADLIFAPADLVADISQITTVYPGDLIALGTPGDAGAAFTPPRFLTDGDTCEVRVTGVGSLFTSFVAG